MNRHPRRFHTSTIAALIALAPVVANQAMAGASKPHQQHAQSSVQHHNAGANNVQHQQQQQAMIQQHQQHQQALIQQQYQHQQALIQQHQQHQQALMQQHQQTLANRKAAANSAVSAKNTTTGSVNPGVANSTTGPIAGLTNPRFSSRRQYSPYSTGGSRNGNNSRQNQQVVSALHSTRNMLTQADHDYNGHRARALHEVGQAIHALSGQSHSSSFASNRTNTGTGNRTGTNNNGNGNNGQPRMSQATSDQHLRQAHQSLMNIQSQMSNNSGSSQHQRANQHVQQATRELNVALNIR